MRRLFGIVSVLALVVAGCTSPVKSSPSASVKPKYGAWGVQLTDMDTTARPGDNFFGYVVGSWTKTAEIRPDESVAGAFLTVQDETDADVLAVVERASTSHAAKGSPTQQVGDLYAAYMDEPAIEAKGLGPIKPELAVVDQALDKAALATTLAVLNRAKTATPFPVSVVIDPNRSDRYLAQLWQGGLSFPNRDYYLNSDHQFVALRADFLAHVERMLALAGYPDAHDQAGNVLALETKLAKAQWPVADEHDPQRTRTVMSRSQVETLGAGAPLAAIFANLSLPTETVFQVGMPEVTAKTARLFDTEPMPTWQAYLRYQILASYGGLLSRPFADEKFNFYSRQLNGIETPRARSTRGTILVDWELGDALGQLYVQQHFGEDDRAGVLEYVERFRKTYSERIDAAGWMAPATKREAHLKLDAMIPKVGYPDRWKSYEGLDISRADLVASVKGAEAWEWQHGVNKLSKPVDRTEWTTTPQTVNAFYDFSLNDLSFPAAVLRPPFYDPAADPAVIYGTLAGGVAIGHEMSHGFDNRGRQYDASGALRDWWTPADAERYNREADKLVAQFDAYEPLPGLRINGRQTLGENIADLAGLQIAFATYRASLGGRELPVLDGFTGDQRFFLAYASCWKQIWRDEYLRDSLLSDVHSPPKFRVNGALRNIDAWYEAFGVQEGNALYLRPADRVRLW